MFFEIWKRTLVSEDCFTNDEKSAFATEFDLPLKDSTELRTADQGFGEL